MSNYNVSLNDIIFSITESYKIIFYLQRYMIFITGINLQNGVFNVLKKLIIKYFVPTTFKKTCHVTIYD